MDNIEAKQSQKASIDLLVEQLKTSSFATRYTIQIKVDRIWSLQQNLEVSRSLNCFVQATDSKEISELSKIEDAIAAKVEEDQTKYAILQDFQFIQSLKVGDKLPIYSNFLSVFNEAPQEIRHQAGEVLLIDVWATWCGPCQAPMQHNQNMLEKNSQKWGDQVKIIAVSVDEDKQEVAKRITDRKWEKIIHYKLNGWDGDHPIIKDFDIKGIPFVALVDTNGTLNYIGHPSEGNLEDRISTLLERKGNGPHTTDLNLDQYKKLKKLAQKDLPELVKSNDSFSFEYSLKFSKISVIKPESEENTYQQPSYISSYDKGQVEAYKEFKKNLSELLGDTFPLKKECEQFKDVKQGVIADLKELKHIFETQQLKNIETQHKVTIKLKLKKEEGRLIYKRSEAFLQYSQLVVTDEALKKQIDVASGQIKSYFLSKFRNGDYADYLQYFFQTGIARVDDSQKLVPKHEIDETAYRKFKEVLESKYLQDLKFQLDLPYDIKLRLRLCRHRVFDYQGNMKCKLYDKPIIKYQVRSDHQELVKTAVIDKIFASIDSSTFVLKPKILNVVNLKTGNVCDICSEKLSIPQYYNYFKSQHLCLGCGDKCDESKNTIERFAVPDNLILFNSSEEESIEEYKLGKNTQPDKDAVVSLKFNFCCSACQKGGCLGRYICLSCRPGALQQDGFIEFCTDCHKKLSIDKDANLLEQVQLNEPNHKLEHLLLNVRTSAGSYYNY